MSQKGKLIVNVRTKNGFKPIKYAKVKFFVTGNTGVAFEELTTDESGSCEIDNLSTPPLEYSMEPSELQPYAEYTIQVQAEGYSDFVVSGIDVMPDEISLQDVELREQDEKNNIWDIVIPVNTLNGDYPAKIPESEVKTVNETGEIVLSRVVIPEYIVVHDGVPTDTTAKDYYVRYKDYIKNVASSELYATWPANTIRANILAIMSFTLNRVYTEWYRGKGYNFTITSSTAFDHKFVYGRNIYQNISDIVNEVFENYLSRPNVKQPILTQYCDGQKVSCPNWMTQWGSKYLGDRGYSTIDILRYYYGSDMYINTASGISGIPSSWPGYDLSLGATGEKVRVIQEQLSRISKTYPQVIEVTPDGIYGPRTKASVEKFQSIFGLPVTGVVDYKTWYEISAIYVAITRIAEL